MTNQKFKYHISINHVKGQGKLLFSYGQTHDIALLINSRGVSIHFQTSKNYLSDFENSYIFNLVKEGIKRAALLYLLHYQKPLCIHSILISLSKGKIKIASKDISDYMIFCQMFDGKLLRPIADDWKNFEINQNILHYRKSKSDISRSIASLYAYLFSKSKNKETERFSYLWIAMNGFFAAVSNTRNEREAMSVFLRLYRLGTRVLPGYERNKVCESATFELIRISEPVTKNNLEDESHKSFADYVCKKVSEYDPKDFDTTPYGFLLTDYPYYLRCTLFHAEHPLELFSFESDWELKSLRIVNSLMEGFLDQNLHSLFQIE